MESRQTLAQLQRMLASRLFMVRPRMASLLRFFVEESLRNGGGPINQRDIATHALALPAEFRPTKSAYVRTHVTRLRQALHDYYTTIGREDPMVFSVTPGPYRLIIDKPRIVGANGEPHEIPTTAEAARRHKATMLVVEPDDDGCLVRQKGIGRLVALELHARLVDSPFVTASGPLLRSRIAAEQEGPEAIASQWGYDYACDITLSHAGESTFACAATVTNLQYRERIFEESTTIRGQDDREAAEAVAHWLFHRVSNAFMTLRVESGHAAGVGNDTLQ